jgi:hypothetical protein
VAPEAGSWSANGPGGIVTLRPAPRVERWVSGYINPEAQEEANMALRAEDLQQDQLLARYLEASNRHRNEQRRAHDGDLLLARYLRALEHHHTAPLDIRTCTHCGRQAAFDHDAGGWGVCSACGVLA